MSFLLVKPDLASSLVHNLTPASARWRYVGFSVRDLQAGESYQEEGDANEVCVVLLSGSARLVSGPADSGEVAGRKSVFDRSPPTALYAPMRTAWRVAAATACEIAICRAPGISGKHPARIIGPQNISRETRGQGSNTRHICNILPETEAADSLLVVEVLTPAGNWSSYPPHKHDCDNLPHESLLEESYYHRINPPQGYVLHRIYTDDRSLDETIAAEDRSVVLVPKGYHPVGAPHGYASYYLNVMAGPKRIWQFRNDPKHEWIVAKDQESN